MQLITFLFLALLIGFADQSTGGGVLLGGLIYNLLQRKNKI